MKPSIHFLISVFTLFICFTCILTIFSCRKSESIPGTTQPETYKNAARFFNEHQTTAPNNRQVQNFVRHQEKQYHFLNDLIKRIGFPYWDKSLSFTNGKGAYNIVYVPFVRDSQNYVNASLIVKMSATDTVFRVLYDWQYQGFGFNDMPDTTWNAKNVFQMFSMFDYNIFGSKQFRITDGRIFNREKNDAIAVTIQSVQNNRQALRETDIYLICTVYEQVLLGFRKATGASRETYTICDLYGGGGGGSGVWFGSDGTGGWYTGSDGGTGGGGNAGWKDPCSHENTDTRIDELPPCGGSSGWSASNQYTNGTVNELWKNLDLTPQDISWLETNPTAADEILLLLDADGYSAEGKIASKTVINLYSRSVQNSAYNPIIEGILNQNLPASLSPSTTSDPIFWFYIGVQAAFNKIDHPEWSNLKCYWEALEEFIHEGLDIAGLVPGFGEVADLTNGVIYTIQGNGVDASLSFAAAIPIAGWAATAAKYAKKTIYALDGTKRTLKWFKKANGFITFGDRKLLRKVLGLAVGDAREAHHIIPWELAEETIIQKIGKSKNAFHLNERYNGIALNAIQHNGSHDLYNARVKKALQDISDRNLSDDDAYSAVKNLIDKINLAITANPNTPVNNILF